MAVRAVRAVRGATQVDADEREQVLAATSELLQEVLSRNALSPDDLISVVFTATPDLRSEFPAYAARREGAFIIAVNCAQAAATCFCTSMKTGPQATRGFQPVDRQNSRRHRPTNVTAVIRDAVSGISVRPIHSHCRRSANKYAQNPSAQKTASL